MAARSKNGKVIWDTTYNGVQISARVDDILTIKVDMIVNPSNTKLRGGSGLNGLIQRAAGPGLLNELTVRFPGTGYTGGAWVTGAHDMKSTNAIIHAIGPDYRTCETHDDIEKAASELHSVYTSSLQVMLEEGGASIAFPTISTGIYRYPNDEAAVIALRAVRDFLDNNEKKTISRIFFVIQASSDVDEIAYKAAFHNVFPDGSRSPFKVNTGRSQSAQSPTSPAKKLVQSLKGQETDYGGSSGYYNDDNDDGGNNGRSPLKSPGKPPPCTGKPSATCTGKTSSQKTDNGDVSNGATAPKCTGSKPTTCASSQPKCTGKKPAGDDKEPAPTCTGNKPTTCASNQPRCTGKMSAGDDEEPAPKCTGKKPKCTGKQSPKEDDGDVNAESALKCPGKAPSCTSNQPKCTGKKPAGDEEEPVPKCTGKKPKCTGKQPLKEDDDGNNGGPSSNSSGKRPKCTGKRLLPRDDDEDNGGPFSNNSSKKPKCTGKKPDGDEETAPKCTGKKPKCTGTRPSQPADDDDNGGLAPKSPHEKIKGSGQPSEKEEDEAKEKVIIQCSGLTIKGKRCSNTFASDENRKCCWTHRNQET